MTDQQELLIDDHTRAPRLSWKALVVIIATFASMVSSYVLVTTRVSAMSERIEEIDQHGTSGMSGQFSTLKDQIGDLRLEVMGQRKDQTHLAEMLEYRLGVIESRLAIARARRDSISTAPRYDSPEPK